MSGRSDSRSETPRSENQAEEDKQPQEQKEQAQEHAQEQGWPAKQPDQVVQQQSAAAGGWGQQPQQPGDPLNKWDVRVNQDGKSWGGAPDSSAPPRTGWGGAPGPQNPPGATQPPTSQNEDWNKQSQWGNNQKNGWNSQQPNRQSQPPAAQGGWGAPPPSQPSGWSGAESKQNTDQGGWNNGGGAPPSTQSSTGWNSQSHEFNNEPPRTQAPSQPNSGWNQDLGGNSSGDHFNRDENGQEKIHSTYGENSNLDEATQKKINSNEGWGTSTIQQSTKWNVEETVPDARSRIHSQSNGTEWWSQDGHSMPKQAEQRPPAPQVRNDRPDRWDGRGPNQPSVNPNQPGNDWPQPQPGQQQWGGNQGGHQSWMPPDQPPRGPHGIGWDHQRNQIRNQFQPRGPYRPSFPPGRQGFEDSAPWDQPWAPPGVGGGPPHEPEWDRQPQPWKQPGDGWGGDDKNWNQPKRGQWGPKQPGSGWGQPPQRPDQNIWPPQPSWDAPGGYPDPNPGFNHNFNQNMQHLSEAVQMNIIPRQMLNDPACANNQNLIQLVKGVIYEANKQQRLNEQMHNAYKHQNYPMNEMARLRSELNRAKQQEQHYRFNLQDFIQQFERKPPSGGGRHNRFPHDRKPENDSYSGGWEHNAQHNLESEISRKLESTSINDDGPPAFEPGKPWPGSNPVNSDPAMDPTKNPNLTPAKYHDMVNRRSNPAGQPQTSWPQQPSFSQYNHEPWHTSGAQAPQGYGWDPERPSPSNPSKPVENFNAVKLPSDLLNQMSSGDN